MEHQPVLFTEVLDLVRPAAPDGLIVDATIGLGGHAEGMLERWPEVRLVGIDRDPRALERTARRLERFGDRVILREGRYEALIDILDSLGAGGIDALLADLGVSSMQLDQAERGFSFRFEGPLDMRMGSAGPTAADLVNRLSEGELTDILRTWGEEPMARRIAAAIVEARSEGAIETTARLVGIVHSVKRPRGDRIDPATLTFQALRIAVNEEIVGLDEFVDRAVERLIPGGRIGIISFHSLEDRVVKRAFRRLEGECRCPPGLPICGCGAVQVVRVLTRRPVGGAEEEISRNPRARSARLRVAEKQTSGSEDGESEVVEQQD